MSSSQKVALDNLWGRYGLELDGGVPAGVFEKQQPITLEIGFGMGDSLLDMAKARPNENFIGIEVHKPGIGHIMREADAHAIDNLKVYSNDSIEVLEQCIAHGSLSRVQIFFPDPWPKRRHHKRRLVNRGFLDIIASRLVSGGILHLATDWEPYAQEIGGLLSSHESFETVAAPDRVTTKYERRGKQLGHAVNDLAARRIYSDQD